MMMMITYNNNDNDMMMDNEDDVNISILVVIKSALISLSNGTNIIIFVDSKLGS